MGSNGMPRRYFHYPPQYTLEHRLSTFGSWILALGIFIAVVELIRSAKFGAKASSNPWGGTTLEWQTASPPITHNFHETPVVTEGPYNYKPEQV